MTSYSSIKRHSLTKERLIKIARDKDGGAHLDKELNKVDGYILSKKGITLAKYKDGSKYTTENSHLCMLRQLGYEVLHSPDLFEFIK